MGRRRVSKVSTIRLWGLLLHKDLLLVLLDHLIILRLPDRHEVYQFVIYMKL